MTTPLSAEMRADLHALVQAWYQEHGMATTLEGAEWLALEVGRVAAAAAFDCGAAACGERAGYQGARLPCACGGTARFVSFRPRWVRGLPGEVRVSRAYYHCPDCHQGIAPWDQEQGLNDRVFTPHLKACVSEVCGREVFQEARETLARLAGVSLAVSSLEEIVGEVGGRLRAAEDAQVQALFRTGQWPPAAPLLTQVAGQRAYLCVDAAKAHTDGGWHDIKVAAFFSGEPPTAAVAAERPWDRVGPKRYLAIQEEAERFGERLYTFAVRLGAERARELVFLGDGADWIWRIARERFSDACEILDFYHASEHVWTIARTVFGDGHAAGSAWASTCAERLRDQGVKGLLHSLAALRPHLTPAHRALILGEVKYFRRHRKRLAYPKFRAAGMMIGSGPVEAACKSVVGGRLKGTGMRWTRSGADAMLAIRTQVLGREYANLAHYARAA
jgi:hypothetical protein